MVIRTQMRLVVASVSLLVVTGGCTGQTPATLAPTSTPLISGALATADPSRTPDLQGTPRATAASARQSPTAIPSPTRAPDLGRWILQATVPMFTAFDALTAGEHGIAVGCRPTRDGQGCVAPAIMATGPGGWTSLALNGDAGQIALAAVAAGPGGFVAVGHERGPGVDAYGNKATTGVALASTDGLTWRRAPDQASLAGKKMNDVVARPGGGWIAIGANAGVSVYTGFETWSSMDGLTWTLIDSDPDVDVTGVTSYGDGLVAWGDGCLDACPRTPLFIWTSPDGTDWVRTPDQPSLAEAGTVAMVGLPVGALAVGTSSDADDVEVGTAWQSERAATWRRRALPDGSDHVTFALAAGRDALLAVGAEPRGDDVVWRTWTSADGTAWDRLPQAMLDAGSMPRVPRPVLAADGRSFVLIGRSGSSVTDSSVFRLRLD